MHFPKEPEKKKEKYQWGGTLKQGSPSAQGKLKRVEGEKKKNATAEYNQVATEGKNQTKTERARKKEEKVRIQGNEATA